MLSRVVKQNKRCTTARPKAYGEWRYNSTHS